MANSFVKVNSYWSVDEANMAKMRLEFEGIRVGLEGANLVAATWGDANAIGGVKLFVPHEDADRAREILDTKMTVSELDQAFDADSTIEMDQGRSDWPTDGIREKLRADEQREGPVATRDLRGLKIPLAWLILVPIFLAFVIPLLYVPLASIFRLVK